MVRRTASVPLVRSTSCQRRPISSPRRSPVVIATAKKACQRTPSAAATSSTAVACWASKVRISPRAGEGGSTAAAGFTGMSRHFTA